MKYRLFCLRKIVGKKQIINVVYSTKNKRVYGLYYTIVILKAVKKLNYNKL